MFVRSVTNILIICYKALYVQFVEFLAVYIVLAYLPAKSVMNQKVIFFIRKLVYNVILRAAWSAKI